MQNTSDLWKKLVRNRNTRREFAFEINGTWYGSETEISHHVTGELFEKFGVGNVCTAKLEAVFEIDEIPAGAEIKRYVRLEMEKYAASAVAFMKPLADTCSVVAPDGQTYYFTLNYWASIEYGSLVHYATLYWSVSGGLTGVVGGAYQVDAAGTQQKWEEAITFTQTPPAGEVTSFNALKQWFEAGVEYSEWLPQGVFYVKRRSESDGIWTIEAYDALRRTGGKYVQEGEQEDWPQAADVVVEKIARRIGLVDSNDNVLLDARNEINPEYVVEHPGDRIVAEVLSAIAAAHFGNFIMSDAGELRLVPLLGLPAETNYLVNEHGDPITFGGVRILV